LKIEKVPLPITLTYQFTLIKELAISTERNIFSGKEKVPFNLSNHHKKKAGQKFTERNIFNQREKVPLSLTLTYHSTMVKGLGIT
jgi:hypothetical protein